MAYVMKLIASVDKLEVLAAIRSGGKTLPSAYLRSFDPDGWGGRGDIRVTQDIAKAKPFASIEELFAEWKRPSTIVPLRDDGKPNRPLTAYTMQPIDLDKPV
jgi:hypothetical protein